MKPHRWFAVKFLRTPICAYCHSIRDDTNYWHRVEEYVSEHAEVTFSHSICPTCLPKVEAEMAEESQT
mgnify:CR=1 FL=1